MLVHVDLGHRFRACFSNGIDIHSYFCLFRCANLELLNDVKILFFSINHL